MRFLVFVFLFSVISIKPCMVSATDVQLNHPLIKNNVQGEQRTIHVPSHDDKLKTKPSYPMTHIKKPSEKISVDKNRNIENIRTKKDGKIIPRAEMQHTKKTPVFKEIQEHNKQKHGMDNATIPPEHRPQQFIGKKNEININTIMKSNTTKSIKNR